jgi:predicted nucleic acid-binding protein
MAIAAEVQRIRDVFSAATDIRVPPFQRSYAWEDEETEVLIKDLLDAFYSNTIYFLGAIVVIRPRNKGPSDVVDGQQRLTTLTIILAVLRDLAASTDEQALLHTMIGHETMGMMFGGGQRWRITLNTADTPFFREHVQERKATRNEEVIQAGARNAKTESQSRLAAAVSQMYDYLSDMSQEDRSRFAQWLLDEVTMVRVRVSEYSVAYRVFQSLNHRGKPLSDHDILKSALFERAGFTVDEAREQSEKWNAYTTRLGDRGFGDMLKQVRSIYDRESAGDMVGDLIAAIIPRGGFRSFLNEQLPRFVDAYDAVVNGKTENLKLGAEALRRLCYLRSIHHESWRAPAITFLVEHMSDPEAADRFFWALDRLAYAMQYSVKDREYRHKRYRRVLDAMDKPGVLFDTESPLDLTSREKADFIERLRGRFPNFKQRRALLMRVSGSVEGGVPLDPKTDCTVEHILPRTPSKGSEWYDEWSRARDRDELTECLGNFTLLTHAENQDADRKSFQDKLQIYFRTGKASYAYSNDLQGRTRWTPEDVRIRRDALIQSLAQDWGL